MPHYVYILKCKGGTYYVGYTNNLERRTTDHLNNRGSKHTKDKKALQLVYHETYPTKPQALKREKQLKGWSRSKKEALMNGNKETLKQLSISHQSTKY